MTIETIICQQGVHCIFSTLIAIFHYFNPAVNESIVFLSSNRPLKFEKGDTGLLKDVKLTNNLGKIATDFYLHHNVYISLQQFQYNLAEFVAYTKSHIEKGEPIAVFLKSEKLKYNRVFKDSNNQHCVLINGFEENAFVFIDSFIPTFPSTCYSGKIAFEDFYTAWCESKKLYYEINYDDLKKELKFEVLKKSLLAHTFGLTSVEKIAAFIGEIPQMYSEDEIRRDLKYFNFKINYDSIIPLRKLLYKCLTYIELQNNSTMFQEEKKCLNQIVSEWYSVELSLLRCTLKPDKKRFLYVSEKIYQINEIERDLYAKVKNIISNSSIVGV